MAEKLKVFTFPCNENDIKAMESWLEDLAAEGYLIDKSLPAGIIHFSEQDPVQVRYCLLFTPEYKQKREITANEQKVIEEQVSAGWEYVVKYGKYLVFMTESTEIAKPVQDFRAAVQDAKQEQKKLYKKDLVLCVLVMVAFLLNFSRLTLIDMVLPFGALAYIALQVVNAKEIKNLERKIASDTYTTQKADWKADVGRYKVMNAFGIGIFALLLIGVIALFYVRIIL